MPAERRATRSPKLLKLVDGESSLIEYRPEHGSFEITAVFRDRDQPWLVRAWKMLMPTGRAD
jgi:hypothetical protein